jgi:tRNA(His) guanylyltransferase
VVGLYWEKYEKQGYNPITGEDIPALRVRIKKDLDLPMKEQYSQFIRDFLVK